MHVKLMNIQANHFKFWTVKIAPHYNGASATISFGRIQSWKQTKVRLFSSISVAETWLVKKAAKKCGQGYEHAPFLAVA